MLGCPKIVESVQTENFSKYASVRAEISETSDYKLNKRR